MKKALVLILSFVLLLAFSAPGLAYTQNKAGAAGSQFKVDLRLVDYGGAGDTLATDWLTKPAGDRGYAKNEIVTVIASVTVPADESVGTDGYRRIQFTGKNVTFRVNDNRNSAGNYELTHTVPTASWKAGEWKIEDDGDILAMDFSANNYFPTASASKTYSFLAFAKITKAGASISFELVKQMKLQNITAGWRTAAPLFDASNFRADSYLIMNDDYLVIKLQSGNYYVFEHTEKNGFTGGAAPTGDPLFYIEKGRNNKTTGLFMYTGKATGPVYKVIGESSGNELMFAPAANVPGKTPSDVIRSGDKNFKALKSYYEMHFEKGLGFSVYNEGNLLTDKDWSNFAAKLSQSATVYMEPWVPYPTAR